MTFSPLTVLGQQLDCCKSVNEIGTFINGYWEIRNPNANEQLRFEFNNEIGKFWRYKFDYDNELIEIEEIKQTLEIFETKSGFELDWSNGNRLGTSRFKILNSTTLVLVRKDGKESKYYRIPE